MIEFVTLGGPDEFAEGSEEEFIAQHYWGYSSQKNGGTSEYRVDHPPWRIWQAASARLDCDVENLYGKQFVKFLGAKLSSAFLAKGSTIVVYQGMKVA